MKTFSLVTYVNGTFKKKLKLLIVNVGIVVSLRPVVTNHLK